MDLTWKCHICGSERPDAGISVLTKTIPYGTQNIRYCNDRTECIEKVVRFSFFKLEEEE